MLILIDVHDVNIQDIGFISGIPHFCGFFGVIGGTIAADFMKNHKMMSVTVVRNTAVGEVFPFFCSHTYS